MNKLTSSHIGMTAGGIMLGAALSQLSIQTFWLAVSVAVGGMVFAFIKEKKENKGQT